MVTLSCTRQTVLVNQSLATPRHMPELTVTEKYIFLSSGVTHRHPLFLLHTITIEQDQNASGTDRLELSEGAVPSPDGLNRTIETRRAG